MLGVGQYTKELCAGKASASTLITQITHQFNALGKRVIFPVLLWKALEYLSLAIPAACR